MEKLTVSNSFQKSLDSLKNIELSPKNKLFHFNKLVEECLQNSFNQHKISETISILFLFCEEDDSTIRINAEENLNRLVKHCETNNIIRIQIDCYHEIKKNGHERSLRIALRIFSYYCKLLKQRRLKNYAQNLLPCLITIGKRREILLIETLSEFLKTFCRYLEICLTDFEILKLLDLFIDNTIKECAIQRRCSAVNVLTIIEHSRRKDYFINHTLNKVLDNFVRDRSTDTTIGSLGLLRLLTPLVISTGEYQRTIEVIDQCLQFVASESNHSVINAALEVVNVILTECHVNHELKTLMVDSNLMHKEMLLRKRSMSTMKLHNSRKSSADTVKQTIKTEYDRNILQLPSTSTSFQSTPNKSLNVDDKSMLNYSDVDEGDSFKSMDFESEVSMSASTSHDKKLETMSLKSQKSSDSINSFFNSILTHTNTESVSKFFRAKNLDSPIHHNIKKRSVFDESIQSEFDEESFDSLNSSFLTNQIEEENPIHIDSRSTIEKEQPMVESMESLIEDIVEQPSLLNDSLVSSVEPIKEIYIGTIFDQSIVDYIVRLVCFKYLLDGLPRQLKCDQKVRVSIKNVALCVVASCIQLKPNLLLIKIEKCFDGRENLELEQLLSHIVDEELEDVTRREVEAGSDEAATAESFLEIKDDHFGECTTATFLDYFSPMSKSIDEASGLSTLKNRLFEKNSIELIAGRDESTKKMNRELCELLTKSETIEPKKNVWDFDIVRSINLNVTDQKDLQNVSDVLLFANHSDLILRANTVTLTGNFLYSILEDNFEYMRYITKYTECEDLIEELKLKNILDILIQGLIDENHTVVKHALAAFECVINHLIPLLGKENVNFTTEKTTIEEILDKLLLVFYNKYFLVQCFYCDVITKVKFDLLFASLGEEKSNFYQDKFTSHLFELIKDNDFRIRKHACEALPTFVRNFSQNRTSFKFPDLLESFAQENIFDEVSIPGLKIVTVPNINLQSELVKIVYQLTNALLNIEDKNQLFGTISSIKFLLQEFDASTYRSLWSESNVLVVLLSYLNHNSGIALDVPCQCEMLEICAILLTESNQTMEAEMDAFLVHLLKIINIYGHLISNSKPLLVPKGQKNDIFISSKELTLLNSMGFFSNDNFYMKMYMMLKSSHANYLITINEQSDQKMKSLLIAALSSLQTVIELKSLQLIKNSIKFCEEVLLYLLQLVVFAPKQCIRTGQVLLKFLFGRNYLKLKNLYDKASADPSTVFSVFEELSADESLKDNASLAVHIKMFDPLVIQSLRLFSKTNCELQATILDQLCLLMDLKVHYSSLDSKQIFMDFVLKIMDLVESGMIYDAEMIGNSVVKFLINLTKQKEQKITIPKIINMIDNLLATTSQVVRSCGLKCLIALSTELFFKQRNCSEQSEEALVIHTKEINTQKEVVLSMMLKFLNHSSVLKRVVLILQKEPLSSRVVDREDTYLQLLQHVKDDKLVIQNVEEYHNAGQLFCAFNKNIRLDSKHFELTLSIYFGLLNQDSYSFQKFALICIINETIISKTEDVYLQNHLKLFAQNHIADSGTSSSVQYLVDLLKTNLKLFIGFATTHEGILDLLENFLKFLHFKQHAFIAELMHQIDLDDVLAASLKKLKVFKLLVQFLLDADKKEDNILSTIKQFEEYNQSQLQKMYYNLWFQKMTDINGWCNEDLMFYFKFKLAELLEHATITLLSSLLDDDKISKIIVKKLHAIKLPIEKVQFILHNAHISCIIESLNYVINKSNITSNALLLILMKKMNVHETELLQNKVDGFSSEALEQILNRSKELLFQKFLSFQKFLESFLLRFQKYDVQIEAELVILDQVRSNVDDAWLMHKAQQYCSNNNAGLENRQVAEFLHEIKSESKLVTIFSAGAFSAHLLKSTIKISFEKMIHSFQVDCIQLPNPHLNYLKVTPLLKISIIILLRQVEQCVQMGKLKNEEAFENDDLQQDFIVLTENVKVYLSCIKNLQKVALLYVEARLIDKFESDFLLKADFCGPILGLLELMIRYASFQLKSMDQLDSLENILDSMSQILNENVLQIQLNQNENYQSIHVQLIELCHQFAEMLLKNSHIGSKYEHPPVFQELLDNGMCDDVAIYKKVVKIGRFLDLENENGLMELTGNRQCWKLKPKFVNISKDSLKLNQFYQYTITPYEIMMIYTFNDNLLVLEPSNKLKLKLLPVPIEYLSDSELLERYVRRISLFGFTQRQLFEEWFMTLLVLLNQCNESFEAEEQQLTKHLCLKAIMDLMLNCYKHPTIGEPTNSFYHLPRYDKLKIEGIGLKKLHHIQLIMRNLNVFYQPNLERQVVGINNAISTNDFTANQFALDFSWQLIEDPPSTLVITKNINYAVDKVGIDRKSSLQLLYGIFAQMLEENPVLMMPQLVLLCEICDDREQFKWINKTLWSMYEKIPLEDTVSHQHIVQGLCKSYAVLVPSMSDLQSLQPVLLKYLANNQLFVRIATLQGLLALFESIVKTNTTMGSLSDELVFMRVIIINYIKKHGIVFESPFNCSEDHEKMVWTLNFYVIETTSKFVPDCDLLANSIISANNLAKRTTNHNLYYLIIQGLERLVITDLKNKVFREKVEKLSMDLIKLDNHLYSFGALKLLITCMYTGSLEQLENTEKSNGIVQDEPEVIIHQSEKIESLFLRIRTATAEEAETYGKVLAQIIMDLLPPNEILTKVIKELLIMNQANTLVIAKIIHQVFRTAIDNSYISLLQDWLICSLQNFLKYPSKSVWFLTLIFASVTLNPHLLKIFPVLLDENIPRVELNELFLVSAKDFYQKLSPLQAQQFKDAFKSLNMYSSASSISKINTKNVDLFNYMLLHL